MSKRVTELFVIDILIAIDKISRYHADFDNAEAFYFDEKSFDATIRELQIIGEATKHLIASDILDTEHRKIVDFRNLIVHEYFGIDADEIWNILHHELPAFQRKVLEQLPKLNQSRLLDVIQSEQKDSRGATAHFLYKLYEQIIQNKLP